MNPLSLQFKRQFRSSHDVIVYFTPNSTGTQVVHRRAHIFILSDLFLMAEWMEAADKAAKAQKVAKEQPERVGQGGPMPEMWLRYPPLAGRHLSVAEGAQSESQPECRFKVAKSVIGNVLTVTIMRKETFVIHAESEVARDQIIKDIIDSIDFASSGRLSSLVFYRLWLKSGSPSSANRSSFSRSRRSPFPITVLGHSIRRKHFSTHALS